MPLFPRLRRRPAAPETKDSRAAALVAMTTAGRPVWTPRDYESLAREGFARNPVAYRCVRMIAEAAASTPLAVFVDGVRTEDHPLARWPGIDWAPYRPVASLGAALGAEVAVCGLVVNERLHDQADGRLMKFVLIADRSGMLECELFADVYERWGAVVARNPVVALRGVVEPFENGRGWTLRVTEAAAPALLRPPESGG